MAIPKFNEFFIDVLSAINDGEIHFNQDVMKQIIQESNFSESELSEEYEKGGNRVRGRLHWAITYLAQSGALIRPKRGYIAITDLGKKFLDDYPNGISLSILRETDGFKAWGERMARGKRGESGENASSEVLNDHAPIENIEAAIGVLKSALVGELLERIRIEDPVFLERLVLQLLHKMGYGTNDEDIEHLGGSGDGGVDGVIHHDKLGLDKIYIQAKRYQDESTIGRPAVQNFVGALTGRKATRGVFMTTAKFSRDAYEYASSITGFNVVLIDGNDLAKLMIEHKVGVTVEQTFELVTIDENFFGAEF